MGLLLMVARRIQLEDKVNDLEYQITNTTSKMNDLSNYASILSQDSITIGDMANIPSSLFAQGMGELAQADMFAQQAANNNMSMAMSSGIFGQTANQNVQGIAWQKMYEDGRKQYQKMIQAKLNEEEKSLQAKQTRLQTQLDLANKELEAVKQQAGKDVESAVGGFGLRG